MRESPAGRRMGLPNQPEIYVCMIALACSSCSSCPPSNILNDSLVSHVLLMFCLPLSYVHSRLLSQKSSLRNHGCFATRHLLKAPNPPTAPTGMRIYGLLFYASSAFACQFSEHLYVCSLLGTITQVFKYSQLSKYNRAHA